MMGFGEKTVRSYKSYKNEQFKKKFDKAKNLLNSIDETSLRKEDKELLKENIKNLFTK